MRSFLCFDLSQATPDHSSLSRIRQRLDVETHQAVFAFVLKVLVEKGLVGRKTLGIDSTTLEANAALKSIVLRDDGTGTTTIWCRSPRARASKRRRARIRPDWTATREKELSGWPCRAGERALTAIEATRCTRAARSGTPRSTHHGTRTSIGVTARGASTSSPEASASPPLATLQR